MKNMTYLTQRIPQKPILRSQFLRLVLISTVLIALQTTPARAQSTTGGKDIEPGNVGVNSDSHEEKLNVPGTIRARSGISFNDRLVLSSAAALTSNGTAIPNAAGRQTTGAKATPGYLTGGTGTAGEVD